MCLTISSLYTTTSKYRKLKSSDTLIFKIISLGKYLINLKSLSTQAARRANPFSQLSQVTFNVMAAGSDSYLVQAAVQLASSTASCDNPGHYPSRLRLACDFDKPLPCTLPHDQQSAQTHVYFCCHCCCYLQSSHVWLQGRGRRGWAGHLTVSLQSLNGGSQSQLSA